MANARVLRRALAYAATFDALVLSHAEDPELVKDASATEGEFATRLGLPAGPAIAEVMMAAAVMALVITTSITTMQRTFLAIDVARGTSYAAQIMQSEFEKMRLQSVCL